MTLVLYHGPSADLQLIGPIAQNIPNSGSYSWTPDTSLTPDTTHYGLRLIVDSNGQYQV